jgi:hypothetical protein
MCAGRLADVRFGTVAFAAVGSTSTNSPGEQPARPAHRVFFPVIGWPTGGLPDDS